MKNDLANKLKKYSLRELQQKIKQIDLAQMSFSELGELTSNLFNEVYKQIQPIRDEMNKKYLEMKKQENLKKAS